MYVNEQSHWDESKKKTVSVSKGHFFCKFIEKLYLYEDNDSDEMACLPILQLFLRYTCSEYQYQVNERFEEQHFAQLHYYKSH